jgi:microcin C transport system permease protein
MISYVLRRLLFMIPTLIGITFIVFMLIAASPGGVGAGLLVSSGGTMQSTSNVAIQRAKLEDRYGLNEPYVVQYFRWLSRISPVKFGLRDLISESGELITRPRPVPEPAGWRWVMGAKDGEKLEASAASTPVKAVAGDGAGQMSEERAKIEAFRQLERTYIEARSLFTANDALLRDALKRYVDELNLPEMIDGKFRVRLGKLDQIERRTTAKAWPEIERLTKASIDSWKQAVVAREALINGMEEVPLKRAGVPIIPGVMHVAVPDLGTAFSSNQPVSRMIARHLPNTLLINIIATIVIYSIAIPSGILAATYKGSAFDVGLGSVYIALFSIPAVLAGVLALGYLATPDYFNLFPTAGLNSKDAPGMTFLPSDGSYGWLLDRGWHLVLPVICSVYAGFAILSKQSRAAMLENFNADYVRTAKAKGVSSRDVVTVHVLRNSLLPLITMFVTIFPGMLAGSVVIERIFSIQGMGYLVIEAINLRDRELILANTTIIACVNLGALLLADILYALVDPRITYK